MVISTFQGDDLAEINEWYEKRELPKMTIQMVPANGFIMRGVAAIFIYLTDAGFALVEGLVSNPSINGIERRRCVRILVDYAYKEAKKQRETVVVIMKNKWVQKLAMDTGYKSLGNYELFIRG